MTSVLRSSKVGTAREPRKPTSGLDRGIRYFI
jgi:hypothetical protein